MNSIAINKEPMAANNISNFCRSNEELELIGTYSDARDAITEIKNNDVGVVFLDTLVPNIERLDFLKYLPNPPHVILVNTASDKVINCFNVNMVTKQIVPISTSKFVESITRMNRFNIESNMQQMNKKHQEFLFIKVGSSTVKVGYDEITYIEGLKDYIKIHLANKKILITKCTVKYIEKKLPQNDFSRIHKSYIIAIDKIDKIEFNHTFIDGKQLPIGLQFKDSFNGLIDQYRL